MEAEVARSKVELLVVGGVIGDVHLTMDASNAAVFLENDGCIVIEARRTALEKAGDEDNGMLAGKGAEEFGGRTWNRLGNIEVVDRFNLTEIGGIVKLL